MNKVFLIGRLTKDPDTKNTANGTTVTKFTLAVDRRFKDANGQRQTDFISCLAWRQTATFISSYFHKGSKIAITGSIQTRNYDDNDGKRVYVTEVVVDEAEFAESSGGQNNSPSSDIDF
jgi:single-strand DNA-binding protein